MMTKHINRNKQCKIKVIDSLMGTGKTTYAIKMMDDSDPTTKYIYVTPFLGEVERIQNNVRNRSLKSPDLQHGRGRKYNSFLQLVKQGENIVTTHKCFSFADDELIKWLKLENYKLIVDEVMNVIEKHDLRKNDWETLMSSGLVEVSDNFKVIWKASPEHDSLYNEIKELALANNLYFCEKEYLIGTFPAKVFKEFSEIYLLTYMFDGQIQKYYYDMHGLEYEYYAIKDGQLVPRSEYIEDRTKLKELICVYDGKLNSIGDNAYSLSATWFKEKKKNAELIKKLKNNIYNYFRHHVNAKSNEILWTTYKEAIPKLKGNGYSKDIFGEDCSTAWNLRATNKHLHKTCLAYCLNRYAHPYEKNYFQKHGIKIDVELLALSDLLQWLFRSAIRNNQPVQLYIPSLRMRKLLFKWLNNEI